MSEEEKKAIEKVVNFAQFYVDEYGKAKDNKYIKILKNLIEKQQKEIEALEIIHNTYKEMIEENNYISKDKIREKIEECRSILYKTEYTDEKIMYSLLGQMAILETLLEEN